jgi:hypothetical protein
MSVRNMNDVCIGVVSPSLEIERHQLKAARFRAQYPFCLSIVASSMRSALGVGESVSM